ncbi:MAG: CopG family transcriptional regulator [Ignavibacteria bacterium]|nr:CopG family transcriptional regulator [Ignavibacteria bacterium]
MNTKSIFTSSLKSPLIKRLNEHSEKYKMPKNKIIENALIKYFDELKREEYKKSFKRANKDPEMLEMAEEGLEDYLRILDGNK